MVEEKLVLDLETISDELEKIETDQILVVIDQEVAALYPNVLKSIQALTNKKVEIWKTPAGERTKNFSELGTCLEFFLEKGIHRRSILVAIGGGAVTDFGGLVSSLLLRGIDWIAVPTTLLGMVDAAVGGKTAINSIHGKNLIGSFHHPRGIYFCHRFLESLSEHEVLSGRGEILKYAFLDKNCFNLVNEGKSLDEIVHRCAEYKAEIVAEDFKEAGKRMLLNLGHTFGHAIERKFSLSHGEAVVWGLYVILFLFDRQELLKTQANLMKSLGFEKFDPPWRYKSFPATEIIEDVKRDKKAYGTDRVRLIVPKEIASCDIIESTFSELEKMLEEKMEGLIHGSLSDR